MNRKRTASGTTGDLSAGIGFLHGSSGFSPWHFKELGLSIKDAFYTTRWSAGRNKTKVASLIHSEIITQKAF
ncbi:MAG: hypothetical protein WCK32_06465 [Chlorobiaceae bacterium]